MPGKKWLHILGIVFMILGLILHIVGMATPQWMVCEYEGKTCNFNLWNSTVCYDKKIKSVDPYEGEYPELVSVKSTAITGAVSGAGAIVSAILYRKFDKEKLFKASSIAISFASPVIEVGATVYGYCIKDCNYGNPKDKREEKLNIENGFRLGYSYYLCVAAGVVMLLGGALFYVWKEKHAGNSQSKKDDERSETTQI